MQNSSFDSQLRSLSHQLLTYSPWAKDPEVGYQLKLSFISSINHLSCSSDISLTVIQQLAKDSFYLKTDEILDQDPIKAQLLTLEKQLKQRIPPYLTIARSATSSLKKPSSGFLLTDHTTIHTHYVDHADRLKNQMSRETSIFSKTLIPSFSPPDEVAILLDDFVEIDDKKRSIFFPPDWKQVFYFIEQDHLYNDKLETILAYLKYTQKPEEFKQWINQVDSKGLTLLHQAVLHGKLEMIQELINYGANIYQLTAKKETAFDLANRIEDKTIRNKILQYL